MNCEIEYTHLPNAALQFYTPLWSSCSLIISHNLSLQKCNNGSGGLFKIAFILYPSIANYSLQVADHTCDSVF
jgi:hypothetical protein